MKETPILTPSEMGRKGGKSKSDRKLEAVQRNLTKARQRRWPKKPKNKSQ